MLAALFAASPALAAQPFDGEWTMSASTQTGTCSTYSFQVGIREGVIQTPPGVPASGSGRVTPAGAVAVSFTAGSDTIQASGKANKTVASGRWIAPSLACAGVWQAQRQ